MCQSGRTRLACSMDTQHSQQLITDCLSFRVCVQTQSVSLMPGQANPLVASRLEGGGGGVRGRPTGQSGRSGFNQQATCFLSNEEQRRGRSS